MDNEMDYSFDAKSEGNILVVEGTGCGKTTFVQNLGNNKIFGEKKRGDFVIKNTTLKRKREKY